MDALTEGHQEQIRRVLTADFLPDIVAFVDVRLGEQVHVGSRHSFVRALCEKYPPHTWSDEDAPELSCLLQRWPGCLPVFIIGPDGRAHVEVLRADASKTANLLVLN